MNGDKGVLQPAKLNFLISQASFVDGVESEGRAVFQSDICERTKRADVSLRGPVQGLYFA
jgi:hypothetical protein